MGASEILFTCVP